MDAQIILLARVPKVADKWHLGGLGDQWVTESYRLHLHSEAVCHGRLTLE